MTCIHVLSIICYIVSYKEKMRTIKQLATLASMPRMCLKRAYFWPQKTPLHPRSCRHSTLVCSTLIPTRVMSRHAVKLPANVGRNPLALSEITSPPSMGSPHLICGRTTTEPLVFQSQKWPRLLPRCVHRGVNRVTLMQMLQCCERPIRTCMVQKKKRRYSNGS